MDRGGAEAIREMDELAKAQLVEQLGKQMKELFSGLAQKQEEENRRLKEENLAIQRQLAELEQEKQQQNSRMEQMMETMMQQMHQMQMQQMGGGQPSAGQPADAELTPAKPTRQVVLPAMPGTLEKQTKAGSLAKQGGAGGGNTSSQQEAELAELRARNREMEAALKSVMTEGEGAGMMAMFLEAKGHSGVVGRIALGGQLPSEAQ